ncbi:MAG TPA: NUDIX hydrolase [Rhodothermales bacterium]|nr:NUDIX hydrolase [Rhodothermales bacterium]
MLLFYCAAKKKLEKIRRKGVKGRKDKGVRLRTRLAATKKKCKGRILVVDADVLPAEAVRDLHMRKKIRVPEVPPEAFLNLNPYRKPKHVEAAGGYVVRAGKEGPEVLLIFRRGRWDLPKGKLEKGETLEECGLREVREEVGIEHLRLLEPLGTTIHGYVQKKKYRVKTTHWYLMQTPETEFTPEADEDIEEVRWMPWSKALRRIGYATLRHHMEQIEWIIQETIGVPLAES